MSGLIKADASDRRLVRAAWTAAGALLAIGLLVGARTELDYRRQAARQVEVQADILAASASAALAFDDRQALREYVDGLRVNPSLASAAIYDASGRAVVTIYRERAGPPPARAGVVGTRADGRRIRVLRPVAERGERLGTVYMETAPESWADMLSRHAGLGLLTVMAFLLLSVVTAAAAQLQARAAQLILANARLREEMDARGKAEEALRQSQKMEALGQLTGGIAHDFNNLLQVVHGAFELIRRRPEDAVKVAAWSVNGLQAAERGASLTRQLLAFSRSQKLELRPFVVGGLIGDMRELLTRTLGSEIALAVDLGDGETPVLSDRTQLELAVLNLAINARDAMPEGGLLTLTTKIVSVAAGDPLLEAGEYVELSVVDTGVGMSPAVMERAFDPFFTTKGVGKGTGLGLSQVYGVARQAGGAARIAAGLGGGTVVSLFLRSSTATPEGPQAPSPQPAVLAPAEGRTVLVVDDEAPVRDLVCETLRMLGYRVLEADSGAQALAILETEAPNLMLCDFAMPVMNGAELALLARRRRPDMPIVFASGHADTAAVEAALGGQAQILRKPFNLETLAETLARLLG